MPNWKKVVTSGSNAHLNEINVTGHITASGNISGSGTLIGGGLNVKGTTTFNDGNITNVGDIQLDSITDDANGDTIITLEEAEISFDVNGVGNQSMTPTSYTIEVPTFIKSHITASGNITASGDLLKTKFVQMTNSSSVIDTFNTGSFRSAKYVLQVTSGSNYQVSEMLVLHHDNLTASNTEYAQLNSGLNLVDFTTSVSGANVKLSAAGSFLSCSVRYDRTIIPI